MATEMSVVCALHQLQLAAWLCGGGREGGLEDVYEELLARMQTFDTGEEQVSCTLAGLSLSKNFGSSECPQRL